MRKIAHYMVITLVAGQLAACQTTSSEAPTTEKLPTKTERINAALEQTAIHAAKGNAPSANLLRLENQYKRSPNSAQSALLYAQALRQAENFNRASLILEPFSKDATVHKGIYTELSMINLAQGQYDMAETYAQKAILQDSTDYASYQNLGIALDAKEMHAEAERAFRKGLEHWQGDPTTIMNNLALNLATQGFVDEAIEVLERAQALSPDRIELERNLRIVRTLNER